MTNLKVGDKVKDDNDNIGLVLEVSDLSEIDKKVSALFGESGKNITYKITERNPIFNNLPFYGFDDIRIKSESELEKVHEL